MLRGKRNRTRTNGYHAENRNPNACHVTEQFLQDLDIAVIVPCYNEEAAIGTVIADFRKALPDSKIWIFDNNSKDRTREIARDAGAHVQGVTRQGKGNVIRQMFANVDADIYVLVDGDDTYEAEAAPRLIRALMENGADMVIGKRITEIKEAYRPGHRLGNFMLTGMVQMIFGQECSDMLSGYRVFSKRFVKSFPALSSGFETETEFTVHALEMGLPMVELETRYKDRPEGSVSKLNTYRDGLRILRMILRLVKEERPLLFFGTVGVVAMLGSIIASIPLFITFFETGLVPRFPTAILATGLMVMGMLSVTCGLILDTVTHGRQEAKRLAYLRFAAPPWLPPSGDSSK